jgi:hypothetical protein
VHCKKVNDYPARLRSRMNVHHAFRVDTEDRPCHHGLDLFFLCRQQLENALQTSWDVKGRWRSPSMRSLPDISVRIGHDQRIASKREKR